MSFIELERQDQLRETLQAHRRRVLADEQHAASLVKGNAPAPEAPFELNDADFVCACGGTLDEWDRCDWCGVCYDKREKR